MLRNAMFFCINKLLGACGANRSSTARSSAADNEARLMAGALDNPKKVINPTM